MKRGLLVVLLVSFLLLLTNVNADIILPGQHAVYYSFEIQNINEFPDYTFFYVVCGPGDSSCLLKEQLYAVKINQTNEPKFYKFSVAKMFAIKSESFDQIADQNNRDLLKVQINDTRILDMNFSFKSLMDYVEDENPLVKKTEFLRIVQKENIFQLEKEKIIYTYSDGVIEEHILDNEGSEPTPSRTLTWPFILLYFFVPSIALIIIIVLLIGRKNEE